MSVSEQLQISGMDVPACAIGTTARAVWAMVAGFRESLETATLLCVSESSSRSRLGPLMECEEVRRRRGKSRLRMPGAERSSESHGWWATGRVKNPCRAALASARLCSAKSGFRFASVHCYFWMYKPFVPNICVIATKLLRT